MRKLLISGYDLDREDASAGGRVPQAKRRKSTNYSLWTSPQSAWVLFLDKIDVERDRKNVKRQADRKLDERQKAFDTQVDQESLIRYVY